MTNESMSTYATVAAPPGPLREFWGYFSANRGAVAGLVVVVAVLLMAAFAEVLTPYPPNLTNNAVFLQPPAWQAGGTWAYPLRGGRRRRARGHALRQSGALQPHRPHSAVHPKAPRGRD